ncbi:MAG TPA: ATP-binding protein [Gemmatimonadaceae bacterium]
MSLAASRGAPAPAGPAWREGAAWIAAAVVVTVGLRLVRAHVGPVHVAIAYLLVVLGGSARCGRRVGMALAALSFLAFNFFFVPPYGTLRVHDPLDWLELLAFFATGAVTAQLLHRAQGAARAAEAHAGELRRLARLGGEALHAAHADDAAAAIARTIREETGVERCELYLRDAATGQLAIVAQAGEVTDPATEGDPLGARTVQELLIAADARSLLMPLMVSDRQVGLLSLRSAQVIAPDLAAHPFTRALAQYAALGLERIALSRAAARAEALHEADRLKDELLSAVSHDLRTPLTSIKATAHEIALAGDERGELIEGEADRLNRYVTNLLDLSRLNAGAVPVHLELVPVEEVAGALLQEVSALPGGAALRVELAGDDALLVGRLDLVLTLRALVNLVENALRHSPGDVMLRVRRAGGEVRFEVLDRGPGIPAADRARLFEPFQRGASQRGDGAGLGLPIARRLVEAQGGTLEVEDREGGGTAFTVRLPRAEIGAGVHAS